MVRRIGEMLRFEADAGVFHVALARAAFYAREVVAGVELHAGLGREDFERAPAGGIAEHGGERGGGGLAGVEDVVVIVAGAGRGEFAAEWFGSGKIHRTTGDGPQFAGRNERGVGHGVAGGGEAQFVGEDIAGTCEVSPAVSAACADARAITLTAPLGSTPSVRSETVTLSASGGAVLSPECTGIGDEQVFSVTVPAGASDLIVTTNVPETMSDTVLASRTVCSDAATETACNDDYPGAPDGDYRSELEISAPGASTQTIIVNTYDVLTAPETIRVEFRLRPRLAPGAACDPAGVTNRCASGACPTSGAAMCPPA